MAKGAAATATAAAVSVQGTRTFAGSKNALHTTASTTANNTTATCSSSLAANIPSLNPTSVAIIEKAGGTIVPLDPIGAEVYGVDLRGSTPPAPEVLDALAHEMATRGFLVFKNNSDLDVDELLRACCWWGGHEMHSTHGVHPATPGGNHHIFRLSNDQRHGILGVGPQWHNDGSFCAGPFSHVAYHIIRPAEKGGGTHFCHQGAAFDALPLERQEFWSRLTSVNSNGGVAHPAVHLHPVTKRKSVYLHLGMTGAVVEKLPKDDSFRLLNVFEMKRLFNEYNDLLIAGFGDGYAISYEYQNGDCIFVDNLAVAHRASPEAHLPASTQGLRIMHRATVRAPAHLEPDFGLPQFLNIDGPSPFGDGVWNGGGLGFRWDDNIHMQN
jgi:taurine dioxygenase